MEVPKGRKETLKMAGQHEVGRSSLDCYYSPRRKKAANEGNNSLIHLDSLDRYDCRPSYYEIWMASANRALEYAIAGQ